LISIKIKENVKHSNFVKNIPEIIKLLEKSLENISVLFKKDNSILENSNDKIYEINLVNNSKLTINPKTRCLIENPKLFVKTCISSAKIDLQSNSFTNPTDQNMPKILYYPSFSKVEKIYFKTFPQGRIIGQFDKKCIIFDSENGLLFIDQHAAHERVCLEIIEKRILDFLNGAATECAKQDIQNFDLSDSKQMLAVIKKLNSKLPEISNIIKITSLQKPIDLLYDAKLKEKLLESQEFLSNLFGFNYEIRDTFLTISSIPKICDFDIAPSHIFDFIKINRIPGFWSLNALPKIVLDNMKTRACKSAIKFGDFLTNSELRAIIFMLQKCNLPSICAHGIFYRKFIRNRKTNNSNFNKK